MTQVGMPATIFSLEGIDNRSSVSRLIGSSDYHGKWLLLIFYPRDFSFVCPTELTSFSSRVDEFRIRNCEILAISIDSIESHRRWLEAAPTEGGVGPLHFPLLSDPLGTVSRSYGVWIDSKQLAARGLFLIDPDGILQYSVVHSLSVGRNAEEILRVLDALHSGGLCPAGWTIDEGIIDPDSLLQPGRVLGHFRIESPLGKGAFGRVFQALDMRLDRPVALKILSQNGTESRATLLAEARVSAKLTHPNICTIYSVDEQDGLPLIVMELIEGPTLSEALKDDLPAAEKLQILRGIASGLESAHALNVVHGDLKPANVMLAADGSPRILDFGLSRTFHEPKSSAAPSDTQDVTSELEKTIVVVPTQFDSMNRFPGRISGTPAYLSPEQAAGTSATTASDVFAFGLIYFEVLTGTRAIRGTSMIEILRWLQSTGFTDEIASRSPRIHQAILKQLLAKLPAQRPTMSTVLSDLLIDELWP